VNFKSTKLAFFSPTGTSSAIASAVAKGIGIKKIEIFDATRPEIRKKPLKTAADELLVVAVPVYAGRIPGVLDDWLELIKAEKSPAVCITLYGNRDFDDALLELKEKMKENGALPVACAAFIGEHSFSTAEFPVAVNRPDESDLAKAAEFGTQIKEKLESFDPSSCSDISVPGNTPYKERPPKAPLDFIAVNDDCIKCGVCADICPVEAISKENPSETDINKCIRCCACIKECPENARSIKEGPILDISKRLNTNLKERKEPVFFF
jgi:ferredoxin